jgi:uncharacterized protein YbcC (UPF0753/DUF2309 family)
MGLVSVCGKQRLFCHLHTRGKTFEHEDETEHDYAGEMLEVIFSSKSC